MTSPSRRPVWFGLTALGAMLELGLVAWFVRLLLGAIGVPEVVAAIAGFVCGFLAARQTWRWYFTRR